jgi:hypothetical protein
MMKKELFIVLIAFSMVASLSFGPATTVNAQAGHLRELRVSAVINENSN